jgi:RHS repeat-associated protein
MSTLMKKMTRALRVSIGGGLLLVAGLVHAGTVTYYYTDPQGTVLAKADAQGVIVARYDYAPYGTSAPNLDAAPAGPGYTGHVNDPDTGLVYMQARYYDPAVGRFLSGDPVGPSPGNTFNFNRYDYTNNNPINHTDPDGRAPDTDFGLGAMAVSAGANPDQMTPALPFAMAAAAEEIGAGELVVGAVKVIAKVIGGSRQTGEKIVSRLAKNAIKDDTKRNVRQIVKGVEHMKKDARAAMKGGKIGESPGGKGKVQTAVHSDGTRVGVRASSGKDGSGPPTIQVNDPSTKIVTKVRYGEQ